MNEEPVIIIGAGWAGLAAAIKLTQAGKNVLVLESAKQTGGRARGVKFNSHNVDNGQHILIGAYYECLNLFKTIGIDTATKLKLLPLQLTVIDKNKTALKLTAPKLPAPYHLLYSLLTAKGLSFKDKIAGIRFGLYLKKNNYMFSQDISVSALFIATKQTGRLIKNLWEPLCLATLNTPVHKASANVFMRVFKDAFTRNRKDADTLLPTVNLSELFPVEAVNYIEAHGGLVKLKSRVENIIIENNKVRGVEINQGLQTAQLIESSQVIIATAPQNLKKLLSKHDNLKTVSTSIKHINFEPIVTIYLQYSGDPKLEQNMTGMSNTLSQWVFDRHD
ncbi:MAG: hydroxysqualene dehydroxylase HpnE, partial [Gammaproteobacteria bacterium]|nr:hydroxysqualene dehydroxylase HpnE [Gammaproteobacteria bacterium]